MERARRRLAHYVGQLELYVAPRGARRLALWTPSAPMSRGCADAMFADTSLRLHAADRCDVMEPAGDTWPRVLSSLGPVGVMESHALDRE